MQNFIKYREFAEKIVTKAGEIVLQEKHKAKVVKQKDIQDIATTADIASEKYVIGEITKNFPDHTILSEEAGENEIKSDFRWIIDPLDGTKEFVRDIPLYNISIALEYKNELVVSALYRPDEKTLYSASNGEGSFKNGNKIRVSEQSDLSKSFIYCYLPSYHRDKDKYEWAFEKLKQIGEKVYRLRSLADENTALCWLAQGGIEAYVNLSNMPKLHDIATGLLIAREAGAYNSKLNMPLVVANNKQIYNELIKIING